jgi:hypothetical protein
MRAALSERRCDTLAAPWKEALRGRFDIPLHLLLLSPEEVQETGFVEFEDALQVWP